MNESIDLRDPYDIDPQDIDVISAKLRDAEENPGFAAEFSHAEALSLGAFRETALSEQDATDSAGGL